MISLQLISTLIPLILQITNSSPVPSHQIILYKKGYRQDQPKFEILTLNQSSTCTLIPETWSNKSIHAVGLEKFCIRFWNNDQCSSSYSGEGQGQTSRCYCDSRYLSFEENNFLISKNIPWSSSIKAVGPCILEGEEDGVSITWLFSEINFKGNFTTLVIRPKECVSFPPGDKWDGYGKSSWLWKGCVKFYEEEYCNGDKFIILGEGNNSDKDISLKSVKSVKNCDAGAVELSGDGEGHGVGVLIYPKCFDKGLPWNKEE